MPYSDHAEYFGQDLILMKSPVNGILFIKPIEKVKIYMFIVL